MEDRTQMMGGQTNMQTPGSAPPTVMGGTHTQMGGMPTQLGFDPMRTAMGMPMQTLEVGNTTNLYDGLMAGCMQIASVLQQTPGYVNRVLLLTDGEPTAGLKDFNSIVQQVAEQKARGISITALGFGSEYNEELMAGIARRSGGNYYYIQRPDLLPEVFRRELETLMTITAKNIRVRLRLPRGVQVRYVYGVPTPQVTQRVVEFTLPDIERGSTVANLSELDLDRHVPGTYRIARV